ncbi:MAG: molybdopterin-guanine dinucleotide biosynthesis protein B [Gallionellaceae bacterium]|nr:MAG: molybdopterin-guanine dinucleotide biosynthesis protein B [Gallionellaceae bacterium]
MKLLSIVGHSGSGKTTLIEKLLPALSAAGLKVATIKHTHHQVPLDTPGKDSWRFKQAGAGASMLVTPQALQLVADMPAPHDPVLLAQRYFGDADLVLAESFSQADCPKIEVLRAACSAVPRSGEGVIALVTDVAAAYPHLPHFALDDVDGIAQFILAQVRR